MPTALASFRTTVDIEGSPHRAAYISRLASMEKGGKETFKLEPDAVARKLVHAVESPRPQRRYYVTVVTYLAAAAKRFAPPFLLDRILRAM